MSGECQLGPIQLCGAPLVSAYAAFTASHRLIVTEDGENRYGVTILIVVVGPLVVQALARVAVCVGAGVDLVVAGAVVGVAAGAVVFATATGCFFFGAGDDGVALGVDDCVAVTGGDCEPCTSTFGDP